MSIETIQQNMKSVLEVIKGYNELIGIRNTTTDKKKLANVEREMDKKREYVLKLLGKVKDLIEEEKKNVPH